MSEVAQATSMLTTLLARSLATSSAHVAASQITSALIASGKVKVVDSMDTDEVARDAVKIYDSVRRALNEQR